MQLKAQKTRRIWLTELSSFVSLIRFIFTLCTWVFCLCAMRVYHSHTMPMEVRRGFGSPEIRVTNGSGWPATRVLRTKPRFSARAASALNYRCTPGLSSFKVLACGRAWGAPGWLSLLGRAWETSPGEETRFRYGKMSEGFS